MKVDAWYLMYEGDGWRYEIENKLSIVMVVAVAVAVAVAHSASLAAPSAPS